jgi:bacterioferritin-associated ferredoxin
MYICICNAITERQIIQAAEGGARTAHDLAHGLGVGLGCGRCTSCAKDLLVEAIARISGGTGGLTPSLDGDSR